MVPDNMDALEWLHKHLEAEGSDLLREWDTPRLRHISATLQQDRGSALDAAVHAAAQVRSSWECGPGAARRTRPPVRATLVALDSFYIGNLKGVGKVYQLTAVDTATRWAMVMIVLGVPHGATTAHFVQHVLRRFGRLGVSVRAVLTDNGPEYSAADFTMALVAKRLTHHRTPPRSPNHNAVCERFHGTILQECWRPAFHRRRFTSIRQLQTEADAWLVHYNTRRRNHSDYMRGPHTPPTAHPPPHPQHSLTMITKPRDPSPHPPVRRR